MLFVLQAFKVSIKVQKKPSHAFGAMFRNTSRMQKFNFESKVKISPISYFADKPEPSVKESTKSQEISNVEELLNVLPATPSSKLENDIILLESDSDAEDENPTSVALSMAADDQSIARTKYLTR
ncbi:hypothetical protein L6452_03736 [Arctium lappa]|uniref:Uncharacterized protein n=1 Tax=Arctium lappa TaxID=4217 RepID=A0ACB9FN49_ARCLA|nr:hypothetical protein L6452_03736 [Arctium lappa]